MFAGQVPCLRSSQIGTLDPSDFSESSEMVFLIKLATFILQVWQNHLISPIRTLFVWSDNISDSALEPMHFKWNKDEQQSHAMA